MPARSVAHSLATSAPRLPRATSALIARPSSTTFSTWLFVSIHLSVESNFRRRRLVERFRSPSASSSLSFLALALAFWLSVAVFFDFRPDAWVGRFHAGAVDWLPYVGKAGKTPPSRRS
jgi:hypothetical protein